MADIDVEEMMTSVGGPLHASMGMGDAQADIIDPTRLAEMEYLRMKRQYFLMQRNRHSLIEKAGAKQAKSLRLLKILEDQRENLEAELSAANSPANQRKDLETKEKIWKLLGIYEAHKSDVERLQDEILDLETTVRKLTSKFYKVKLKIQAVLGIPASEAKQERSIEHMEGKLFNITSQCDVMMVENRELKEDISMKIQYRCAIFHRMQKVTRKIQEIRAALNASVDEALQEYNAWDDAHQKIEFIKEKWKEELRQHILEMKEFDRLLFHDLRELRFYTIKNQTRPVSESTELRTVRKSVEQIRNLLKAIRKCSNQLKKLQEFDPTGSDANVIRMYTYMEQENFSIFKQLTYLNSEVDHLSGEVVELKEEVETINKEKNDRQVHDARETVRINIIKNAEQEKLATMSKHLEISDEAMQRILTAIEEFCEIAECDLTPLSNSLGVGEFLEAKDLNTAFNMLEHHIAAIQLEKELLSYQKHPEQLEYVARETKPPKSQGGPYETTVYIPNRTETKDQRNDQEDAMLGSTPLSKSVQRELVRSQLKTLGLLDSSLDIPAEDAPQYSSKYERKAKLHKKPPEPLVTSKDSVAVNSYALVASPSVRHIVTVREPSDDTQSQRQSDPKSEVSGGSETPERKTLETVYEASELRTSETIDETPEGSKVPEPVNETSEPETTNEAPETESPTIHESHEQEDRNMSFPENEDQEEEAEE